MKSLEELVFDNGYARLAESFYSRVEPTPLANPYLVAFNRRAAELIDLDPAEAARPEFVDYFAGARPLPGSAPVAMLYSGHQFGHYVPRLGDGRAILLGQVRNRRGESWDLHLKGAGLTAYSRDGDGRAVLRSTVREYLCSEAMHGLGIPTTRALCMVGSDEEVYRERVEKGAMLLRLAPSHVRFGSFEVLYYGNRFDDLKVLADHVMADHFPALQEAAHPYLAFLDEVVARTARLVARWQQVGFAHGVMNTDNMSVLGLTMDYGPFGFLDAYDPDFICNHSDHRGRYAFNRQPRVALWNLSCFAQALLPLLEPRDGEAAAAMARESLAAFEPELATAYAAGMRSKLGLFEAREGDNELVDRLLELMAGSRVDYTRCFRDLAPGDGVDGGAPRLRDRFHDRAAFDAWAADYDARMAAEGVDPAARRTAMNRVNPEYILRNHLAQQAIERAEAGDHGFLEDLVEVLHSPFDEHPARSAWAEPPPQGAPEIVVSCSS
ncbi:MAG: YdiU family protein [Gammaproteobacteria bacterium]|nr:YdiU family protein [Gammaproteobacteria bacterium]